MTHVDGYERADRMQRHELRDEVVRLWAQRKTTVGLQQRHDTAVSDLRNLKAANKRLGKRVQDLENKLDQERTNSRRFQALMLKARIDLIKGKP